MPALFRDPDQAQSESISRRIVVGSSLLAILIPYALSARLAKP